MLSQKANKMMDDEANMKIEIIHLQEIKEKLAISNLKLQGELESFIELEETVRK